MKKCRVCKNKKNYKLFYKMVNGKRNNICRKCVYNQQQKWSKLNPGAKNSWSRKYDWKIRGIKNLDGNNFEWPDFKRYLKKQNNKCAICGISNQKSKATKKRGLVVDHNHKTGIVRGLLCCPCNLSLGSAHDSIDRLKLMVKYLEEYE